MTPAQRQKLAALRRMADHASTPENERISAKRRIAEMEEKYGTGQARDITDHATGFHVTGFTVTIDDTDHVETFRPYYEVGNRRSSAHGNIPPRPFIRRPTPGESFEAFRDMVYEKLGVTSRGQCRCHTVPINEENNSEWVFSEWARWCCGRNPGLHGRIPRFWKEHDVIAGNTRYCWYCPTCDNDTASDVVKIVRINVADLVAEYATPTAIKTMLFAMFNGDTNNRCSRCSRSADIGKPKEEDYGHSSSDGEG